MHWTRFFYWCFRWTLAVPIALTTILQWCLLRLFERAVGIADDYAPVVDREDLKERFRYLFTMKLR
jgi:hypothetical protein